MFDEDLHIVISPETVRIIKFFLVRLSLTSYGGKTIANSVHILITCL